jgi:hypothetical protein
MSLLEELRKGEAISNDPTYIPWTLEEALPLIRVIEQVMPQWGYHVALTGGLLYKDGPRKDLDLIFYTLRDWPSSAEDELYNELEKLGFKFISNHGWVDKWEYQGKLVECFFPEKDKDEADKEYNDR